MLEVDSNTGFRCVVENVESMANKLINNERDTAVHCYLQFVDVFEVNVLVGLGNHIGACVSSSNTLPHSCEVT